MRITMEGHAPWQHLINMRRLRATALKCKDNLAGLSLEFRDLIGHEVVEP